MTSPTPFSSFDLQNLDMAFVISQQELNEGLAEFISSLSSQLSWAYDVNEQGNLVPPANPRNPDISFSGIIAPPQGTQPLPWILDLSQASADNQVKFTLYFQDGATFVSKETGKTYTQNFAGGGPLWPVPFQVDLTVAAVTANAPQWLQQQMALLQQRYGDVFDLSQVMLDLQSLALTSTATLVHPTGFLGYDWALLVQGMAQYLASPAGANVFTAPPAVGYVATHNGNTPAQQLPTFTPTNVDFVVVPNAQTPGCSALVFALMVKNDQMPTNPALEFSNAQLITDATQTPGVALIRSELFTSFFTGEFPLSQVATAISQYVQSIPGGGAVTWQLAASPQTATTSVSNPSTSNGQYFSGTMPEQTSNASYNAPFAGSYSGQSITNSTFTVQCAGASNGFYQQISLTGVLSFSVSQSFTPTGRESLPSSWTSPTFEFSWKAIYDIEPVNNSGGGGGGVAFTYQASQSSFPGEPTSEIGGGSSWSTVKPTDQQVIKTYAAPAIQQIPSALQTGIVTALGSLGAFVFPGGRTFNFSNPGINQVFALCTTIQYQNPN